MPVMGLFLELFAVDKYAGSALWLTVTVLIWFGCFADFAQQEADLGEDDAKKLRRLRVLPPAYLFVRGRIRGSDSYKGIALGMLMLAAIFANGFTQGLMLNEKNMPDKIAASSVMNLENFTGSSDNIIGEQLDGWFDDGYETQCEHSGERFTIVFSGSRNGQPAEVGIAVVHDGFTYQSIKADTVKLDGKTLDEDERNDVLKEIFIGEADSPDEASEE